MQSFLLWLSSFLVVTVGVFLGIKFFELSKNHRFWPLFFFESQETIGLCQLLSSFSYFWDKYKISLCGWPKL